MHHFIDELPTTHVFFKENMGNPQVTMVASMRTCANSCMTLGSSFYLENLMKTPWVHPSFFCMVTLRVKFIMFLPTWRNIGETVKPKAWKSETRWKLDETRLCENVMKFHSFVETVVKFEGLIWPDGNSVKFQLFFFKNLRLLFYLDIGLSQGRCCEKNGPFSLFSVSSLYKSLRNVTLSPLVNFGWAWLNPLLFWYRLIPFKRAQYV